MGSHQITLKATITAGSSTFTTETTINVQITCYATISVPSTTPSYSYLLGDPAQQISSSGIFESQPTICAAQFTVSLIYVTPQKDSAVFTEALPNVSVSTNDTSKVKDYSLKWVAVLDVKYKNQISPAANYEFPFTVTIKNCKTTTISISNIPSQTAYTYSINPTLSYQQTY